MTRPDRRAFVMPAFFAIAAALLLALGVPNAFGALIGKLTNTTASASSNAYYLCTSAAQGNLTNNAYFAYPLIEAAGTTAGDVSGNGRSGSYTSTGVQYRTTGAPCKRDNGATGYAVTLNGSSGYISGPTTAMTGPNVFSIEIWFRTSVAGGKLIGFGSSRTGSSSSYDRHLYIDSGGYLRFGVYPNAVKTVTSPTTVTDNKWHHAVGTLSASGMVLYLDGTAVASDTSVTSAQSFTGYWRVGYDNLGSWTSQPSNFYFTGDLAWAEAYTYALTADQAKSHYLAGTG